MTDHLTELRRLFDEYDEAKRERDKPVSGSGTVYTKRIERLLDAEIDLRDALMELEVARGLVDVAMAAQALLWLKTSDHDSPDTRLEAERMLEQALSRVNGRGDRVEGERMQDWFFTFGSDHRYPDGYVVIHGTEESAREEMVRRYDMKWAFQYPSAEDAGVERYMLTQVD